MTFWTDERLAELARLRALGLGALRIARRMGTTKSAVHGKLYRQANVAPKADPAGRHERSWEDRLTERWADRKQRRAA